MSTNTIRFLTLFASLTLSPVAAQPMGPDAVLQSAAESGYTRRYIWSAWQSPGELAWSFVVNCRLHDSVTLDGGDTIATAHCPVKEEGSERRFRDVPIVARIDGRGKLIWSKRLDLGEHVKLDQLLSMPDSRLAIFGTRSRCRSVGCQGSFVVDLDQDGNLLQARALRDANPNGRLVALEGGDLIGASPSSLWRLKADGAIQWARSYRPDLRYLLPLAARNGVIVSIGQAETDEARQMETIVLATDYEGKPLWSRVMGLGPLGEITSAVIDDSGTVHLGGSAIRMGPKLEDKVYPRADWITRLSPSGELLTSSTINDKFAGGLRTLRDGSVFRIGRSSSDAVLLHFDFYDPRCVDHEFVEASAQSINLTSEAASFMGKFEEMSAEIHDIALVVEPGRPAFDHPCATGIRLNR